MVEDKYDILIKSLANCPPGTGWMEYERIVIKIISELFIPPLTNPRIQPRTYHNMNRRDLLVSNHNLDGKNPWGFLYHELRARVVVFEFKCYDKTEIGKNEISQVFEYMQDPWGKLGFLICNKNPSPQAISKSHSIFNTYKKIILILTDNDLNTMLKMKKEGGNPGYHILNVLDTFYYEME